MKRRKVGKIFAFVLLLVFAAAPFSMAYAEGNDASAHDDEWELVFSEEFSDPVLNPSKFSDSYMPHWTTVPQSLAHYEVRNGILSLNIEKDTQGPWWAFDDVQKISSIQTGMRDGMHLFWDTCTITDHHRAVTNFETRYGYFELRAKVPSDSGLHSAWWMTGTEARADETAEIDIFEICGPDCSSGKSRVRVSVHPWKDPALKEQSLDYYPACDVSEDFHTYGFEWKPDGMRFYFDGRLVKETTQSPDYKMTTLLGIYENDSPLWSGTPDYNSTYPKRFEIDYFRVYKTKEMLAQDASMRVLPTAGENIAPYAVAGAGQDWSWDNPPSKLIDNDAYSAMQSNDSPVFPQYLYFDWDKTQGFDTVIMKTAFGQGQGPTSLDLEVSEDGESNWTAIASYDNIEWGGNDWHIENFIMSFPKAQGKALRLKINSANLQWNHYAINEIIIKDSEGPVGNANIAPESTPEWNSENGGLLTDNDLTEAAESKNRSALPTDIVLKWPEAVALNQIELYCWYAQSQAPTQVSFSVSEDGNEWREIVPPTDLTWQYNDATMEKQSFSFATVTDIKYLRLQISKANLKWRHFAINELKVFAMP